MAAILTRIIDLQVWEFPVGLITLKFKRFKYNFGMLIPKLTVLQRMYKFWLSDLD